MSRRSIRKRRHRRLGVTRGESLLIIDDPIKRADWEKWHDLVTVARRDEVLSVRFPTVTYRSVPDPEDYPLRVGDLLPRKK